MEIQPFTATAVAYAQLTELHNAVWPDLPREAADWQRYEAGLPDHIRHRRWVVEEDGPSTDQRRSGDGRLLASGGYAQNPYVYQPDKYSVGVGVRPEARRRGIGGALYDHVIAALAPFDPAVLETAVGDEDEESAAFAARRGFVEEYRIWELALDVAAFDPAPFADLDIDPSLTLKTLRQLLADDPDVHRKLYELDKLGNADAPSPDPITLPPFDRYVVGLFDDPNLLLDGFFVAVDGNGRYIGRSNVELLPGQEGELEVGFTCIRRDHRRRGLALALKLRGVDFARSEGYATIRTASDSTNRGMLALNQRLGFARQSGTVHLRRTLR